jgi:hypothetical protein
MEESLLNPNQMRSHHGVVVDTCPKQFSNGKLMHGIYVTKDDLFLCIADAWNHFVLVNLLVSSNGASDGLLPVTIIIILYKSPRRPKLQQQQPPRIPVLPD